MGFTERQRIKNKYIFYDIYLTNSFMIHSTQNKRKKKKFRSAKLLPKKEKKIKWNKKSILFISSFGVALLLFVGISTSNFQISSFFNSKDNADYRTTNATVYSYETKSMMQQTKYGGTNQIVGYLVRYRYKVNEKIYDHEEILNMNAKPDFLIYIMKNLNTDSFLVQYEITNPENSYLFQKE